MCFIGRCKSRCPRCGLRSSDSKVLCKCEGVSGHGILCIYWSAITLIYVSSRGKAKADRYEELGIPVRIKHLTLVDMKVAPHLCYDCKCMVVDAQAQYVVESLYLMSIKPNIYNRFNINNVDLHGVEDSRLLRDLTHYNFIALRPICVMGILGTNIEESQYGSGRSSNIALSRVTDSDIMTNQNMHISLNSISTTNPRFVRFGGHMYVSKYIGDNVNLVHYGIHMDKLGFTDDYYDSYILPYLVDVSTSDDKTVARSRDITMATSLVRGSMVKSIRMRSHSWVASSSCNSFPFMTVMQGEISDYICNDDLMLILNNSCCTTQLVCSTNSYFGTTVREAFIL